METTLPAPVAVDAMGGDHAPNVVVEGAIDAVRAHGIPVTLVGPSARLGELIAERGGPLDGLGIVEAPDIVAMEEQAVAAVRRHTRASMLVGLEEVRDGRAAAFVSAGNSGAVVVGAIFVLGRLKGIQRPGILIPFPTTEDRYAYLIDAGAVVDPRPTHLVQYAYLATSYLRAVAGIERPRVGLLSNGAEPGKGNSLTRETFALLSAAEGINFAGNVEANTLPTAAVDVAVCDGFSGNVLVKSAEGAVSLLQTVLRRELTRAWHTRLLAAALRPSFRRATRSLDYREYGGAPLLGVRGVVYIAHGRSDRLAISNAIRAAAAAARRGMLEETEEHLARHTVSVSIAGDEREPTS